MLTLSDLGVVHTLGGPFGVEHRVDKRISDEQALLLLLHADSLVVADNIGFRKIPSGKSNPFLTYIVGLKSKIGKARRRLLRGCHGRGNHGVGAHLVGAR